MVRVCWRGHEGCGGGEFPADGGSQLSEASMVRVVAFAASWIGSDEAMKERGEKLLKRRERIELPCL